MAKSMAAGPQATMEWEAQDEGVLAKILVGDGAQDIKVGTLVAVVVDDKADVGCLTFVAMKACFPVLHLSYRQRQPAIHLRSNLIRCRLVSPALRAGGKDVTF